MTHPGDNEPPDGAAPLADEPDGSRRPTPWIIIAMLLSLAFLLPLFLMIPPMQQASIRASAAVRAPFIQLDNEEGALLFQAMQMRQGQSIYRSLNSPPYVAGTYTPLYMAAVAALDDFQYPTFRTGRMLVWVCAWASGLLLMQLLLVTTRNVVLAFLGLCLFLGTWEVFQWIGYFRVDFMAMALSLAGLAVIVSGGPRRPVIAVGALLMTLAIYTKQTMIAAPLACAVALAFQRPRRSVEFVGWMALWGIPPAMILHLATDGQFLCHILLYNMNTSHLISLKIWLRHILFMHQWTVVALALALPFFAALLVAGSRSSASLTKASDDDPQLFRGRILFGFWQPLGWYALFAQWNILAIAKAGSAENYLLEPVAGWAIILMMTAGAAVRVIAHGSMPLRLAGIGAILLILLPVTRHAMNLRNPQEFAIRFNESKAQGPAPVDYAADARVMELVRSAEHPLTELAIHNIRRGHNPIFQPFIMSELARQGRWDQTEFVESLRAGEFDLIVTLDDVTAQEESAKFTQEMLMALRVAYEVDEVVESQSWKFFILRPRETGAEEIATSQSVRIRNS